MKIEIEVVDDEYGRNFIVVCDNKYSGLLSFDEMLGVVAVLTMPEPRPCQFLKTHEQHQRSLAKIEGLKQARVPPVEFMERIDPVILSVENIIKTVKGRGFSPDSIRSLAYVLESRNGRRSDAVASELGRQLTLGRIEWKDAEYLIEHSGELNLSVWDEVEAFVVR